MLTFRFTGTDGCMLEKETLTSGMVGKKVRLEFSGEWSNLRKTAVFMAGSVMRDVVDVTDEVEIPAEVLAVPLKRLYVGVYGVSADGAVTPTIRAKGPMIEPGADPSGDEGANPELPVWAQILAMIGILDDLNTGTRESLVAAINEVLTKVGADPAGTAASKVSEHNTDTTSHNDLRLEVKSLAETVAAFLDSDDVAMDQLSELLAAIGNNQDLIAGITTGKVSVADIIDNLVTNVANKPLSAAQGVVLKALIDDLTTGKLDAGKLQEAINTALAQAKASGEFDGADGKTPVKGEDYYTDEDKAELEAYIAAELEKQGQIKPDFADSIEECTDTTKLYVLPDGYIYGYTRFSGQLVPNFTNQFSKDKVYVNHRYAANKLTDYASQSGTVNESYFTGHFALHDVPIDFSDLTVSHVVRIANFPTSIKVKSCAMCPILSGTPKTDYALPLTSTGDGYFEVDAGDLSLQTITASVTSCWHTDSPLQTKITSFGLVLKLSDSTITLEDVPDDLIITVDEPIEYTQEEDYYGWANTGHAFVPADYEDRIVELEAQTAGMQADIDTMKSACLNANLLKSDIVRSVNHRGYHSVAPENTLPAYKLSKAMGFEYVECDVSITKDGEFVLLHNATIDDTSDGTGTITEMTLEEVRAYDFGSWKSEKYAGTVIPTLEEFLILCRNIGLKAYLELKNGTWTQERVNACVAIVRKCGMARNVTWIQFGGAALQYVANADSKTRLGLLSSALSADLITNAATLKNGSNEVFVSVQNADNTVDDALVTQCIENDIGLEVWNVNTESGIAALHPYVSGATTDALLAGNVLYNAAMTS